MDNSDLNKKEDLDFGSFGKAEVQTLEQIQAFAISDTFEAK